MAFLTFLLTFSKVAGFATFWENRSFFTYFKDYRKFDTEYALCFIFKANIFGRKVSERNDSVI